MTFRARPHTLCLCVIWLAPLALVASVSGQQVASFSTFSTADGLSHAKVNGMAQDPAGFVWIATGRGLSRFDGIRFLRFDPESIVDGKLEEVPVGQTTSGLDPAGTVIMGESGYLWSATVGAILRVDPVGMSVTRFPFEIEGSVPVDLVEDPHGYVWVAAWTDGLLRLDPASGEFLQLLPGSVQPSDLSVAEDGRVWVATLDGLQVFEGIDVVRRFGASGLGVLGLSSDRVRVVSMAPEGTWVGTESGLDYISEGEHVERVPLGQWDGLMITALETEGPSTVWIGTDQGLVLHDRTSGSLTYFEHSAITPASMVNGRVTGILGAKDGSTWIGSDRSGFSIASRDSLGITRHAISTDGRSRVLGLVTSFSQRRAGDVLVGATEGLFGFQPESGELVRLLETTGLVGQPGINAVLERADGSVWIGTEGGGFGPVDLADGTFSSVALQGRNTSFVYSMFEDAAGSLWVGTFGGLLRVDARSVVEVFRQGPEPNLPSDWITNIAADQDGQLWIATNVGVSRFDPQTRSFENLGFGLDSVVGDPGVITGMDVSVPGQVWVTSAGAGLFELDAATGHGVQYSLDLGTLESNELSALARDQSGALWLQHPEGYMRFSLQEGLVSSTAFDVGVLPYDVAQGVSLTASGGALLFGTQRGIAVVRTPGAPAGIGAPAVALAGARAAGVLRPVEIEAADAVRVQGEWHREDFPMTLQFASPHFPFDQGLNLTYRTGGTDWLSMSSGVTELNFLSLPSGWNTLDVAWNAPGEQRGKALRVSLYVTPPWYTSWWALLLGFLGLTGTVSAGVRYRTRSVVRDNLRLESLVTSRTAELAEYRDRLEEQNVELARLDEAKNRFFVNISHDFRTPLTLILGPLEEMVGSGVQPTESGLARMHRNALRLMRLISQVMDLARLDAGKLELEIVRSDIYELLAQCVSAFEGAAEARHIQLELEGPTLQTGIDPAQLEKIILNLLSNAFKHTPAGGRIRVVLGREPDGFVSISVADTGRGIEANRLDSLFDRFYHGRDSAGSGVGLSLVKELVELHGGTVSAASTPGEGSVFTIRLPNQEGKDTPSSPHMLSEVTGASAVEWDLPDTAGATSDPSIHLKTILLIEDHRDLMTYLVEQFDTGYTVLEAHDGAMGLEMARETIPDLIVSDVMMPEIDGIQLLQALREDRRTCHIPIVLLTARADVESMLTGIENGADAYISKPFQARVLSAQVAALLVQRERLRGAFGPPGLMEPEAMGLSRTDEAFLREVRKYVDDGLSDPDFGVEQIAAAANLSPRQLSRKLKALVGATPGSFLRSARLGRAAQMLAGRAASVKEVSFAVGYRSQTQFSGQFKDQFGVSPSAWTGKSGA